jgi:hypothetical protein
MFLLKLYSKIQSQNLKSNWKDHNIQYALLFKFIRFQRLRGHELMDGTASHSEKAENQ